VCTSFVRTYHDAPLIIGAQEGAAHPTAEKGINHILIAKLSNRLK
jgi:hypothetical protein